MSRLQSFFLLLLITASSAATAVASQFAAQDPNAVSKTVRHFLEAQAKTYPGTAQIVVDAPDTNQLAACNQLQVFLRGRQRLRARLSVGVRCLAPELWTTYVQASVAIHGNYYVAAHSISPDATISSSDLDTRTGDLLRLPRGVVLDPARLIGYVATQRIRSGQPIKARAVRSPESIQRGQAVRTVARGTVFVASGSGKALDGGPPGSPIQVPTTSENGRASCRERV